MEKDRSPSNVLSPQWSLLGSFCSLTPMELGPQILWRVKMWGTASGPRGTHVSHCALKFPLAQG